MAENVKQHVVPRFALAFCEADALGRIFVRIKGKSDVFLKSPSGQGYEDDAFTVINDGVRDTSCDNANQVIENWCAPHLAQLTNDSTPTDDQWRAIFFLTANLICRSRWARDHNLWQLERAQGVLPTAIEAIKEMPQLPESVRQFGFSGDEMNDLPSMLDRACKLLYPLTAARGAVPVAEFLKAGKDCDLLLAPAGSTFITSDEPALILQGRQPAMLTVGHDFLARADIEVYVPLKPNIACLWSATSARASRSLTTEEVTEFNRKMWETCYERVFAARRSDLEQF